MKKLFTPLFLIAAIMMHYTVSAQYTATWALTSNKTVAVTGTQATGVTAGSMIPGTNFPNPGSHNTDGYQAIQTVGDWPTVPTDGFNLDFPLSPNGAVDVTISSVTCTARTSGGSGNNLISLAYQADGAGPWVPFGTPQTATSGGASNQSFTGLTAKLYSGHTYAIRMYIYAAGTGVTTSRNVRIRNVVIIGTVITPAGTPPTVTTNNVSAITKYAATATGTLTAGTLAITTSGVVWSTAANPTVALTTKTTNGPLASGTITGNITGLTAGTLYHVRAYATSESGSTSYGADLTFTTLPPSIPALTTSPVTNIQVSKATSGGNITDSGGVAISEKGVVWSTSPNPTTALSTKTNEGRNATSFTSLMRILQPSTTYYVRAFAINSLGTGYGNEISFTTPAPAPVLIATPVFLNFGTVTFGSSSPVLSYTLTGNNLSPAAGNITIAAPAGYVVSTSPTGTFTTTLTVPYTGGALAATSIYVKLTTANYGGFNGTITNAGGGATAGNSDNVDVAGSVISDPNATTNVGTDFWTGFGYQENMDQSSTSSARTRLSLYISVPSGTQNAIVNVEMPGIPGFATWQQNLVVTPGVVTEVTNFPSGGTSSPNYNATGLPDARLYATGVSGRGIHVYTTNGVPVSVWMHSYATNNSAAGSMLFPTNTWNSSYTVQAYGGNSNNDNPNSFFFVVANEDNTPIWFTPSQDVLDSITGSSGTIFTDGHTAAQVKYHKGIEYGPIVLNKGQVFNAMGFIAGNGSGTNASNAYGLDLTGSKVRTNCDKKLAVFGGNGRCLINATGCTANEGSDHMIQQMFPGVAWGTKYLTAPTKTMEYNLYRINVSDPATLVWVNDAAHVTPLTGLINNLYYEIQGNAPFRIESSKPVNVTQFIVAGGCANQMGSKGLGDPEMIILSPVQQAINKTTVYSATIKNPAATYNGHYINVIIKNSGISSFRLDGLNVADTGINQITATATTCYDAGGTISIASAFVPHPFDAGYSYAKFKVTPGTAHTLVSDSTFNAIAYGMGDGESYGYNAGTVIKDLNTFLGVINPYANTTGTVATCKGTPFILTVTLPYKASSLIWDFSNNPNISPNTIVIQNPATPSDSVIQDGTKLYVFKIPTPYIFSALGTYNVSITSNNPTTDGCPGLRTVNLSINVFDKPQADFTASSNGCPTDVVNFLDATNGFGRALTQWNWAFGDGGTSAIKNPSHVYPAPGTYNVSIRAISDIGCFHDTTKPYTVQPLPTSSFTAAAEGCVNTAITFTSTATTTLGTLNSFTWNYGDASTETITTSGPRTHTYTAPGTYTVTLVVKSDRGCQSTVFSKTIIIYRTTAEFTFTTTSCANIAVQFTDASSGGAAPVTINSWLWNFGVTPAATSTVQNPTYTFTAPGTYNVSLQATSTKGCVGTVTKAVTILGPLVAPVVTASNITATSITFTWAAVTGAASYAVSIDGGTTFSTPSSGSSGLSHVVNGLQPNQTVAIIVRATGINSCQNSTGTATAKTLLPDVGIFVANTFTPNGDGKNDLLMVRGNYIKTMNLKVFNQWGEMIYENTDVTKGWDGTHKGKPQPVGVYVYILNVVNQDGTNVNKKGSVNLIR